MLFFNTLKFLLAGVLGLAVGTLTLSAEIIEPNALEYLHRLQQRQESVRSWAQSRGLPVPPFSSGQNLTNQLTQEAIGGIKPLLFALSLFVLVISLLALLLLVINQYKQKVQRAFPSRTSDRLIDAVSNMSEKLRRLFWAK